MPTKIEWTEEVWNPVTGCTKVSQGCKNCYAERIANRFWGKQEVEEGLGFDFELVNRIRPRKFTDVQCHRERLEIPLHWKKPRRIFVNSMSDLFHDDVPDMYIYEVFSIMANCSWHTFQVLTKRPERLYDFCSRISLITPEELSHLKMNGVTYNPNGKETNPIPLPNVWIGVSIENQQTANERIPWLLKTPANLRFVSYEPALGPVDFTKWGYYIEDFYNRTLIQCSLIDWIITGCESGPYRRPANPDWFRGVRDQCVAAGIPFFLKQMEVNGKIVKMPELDGRVWCEYPEVKP